MTTPEIILCVVGSVLGFVLLNFLATLGIAGIVHRHTLVRTNKKKWSRDIVSEQTPTQIAMFDEGLAWYEQNKQHATEVFVTNDKLTLAGEYFDFGFNRAVYIIQGRSEALRYSYFFAKPYQQLGFNVLVCDGRAHGKSDGRYNTVGIKEHRDTLAWIRFLHEEKGNEGVLLHGICIGSATSLYACTSADAPDYLLGMVAEGMFVNFEETFRLHMVEQKRPIFPFLQETMWILSMYAGTWYKNYCPEKFILQMQRPILFIAGKEDTYSLPHRTQQLFDTCASPNKQLVWMEKGEHSKLRLVDHDGYDQAIANFVQTLQK